LLQSASSRLPTSRSAKRVKKVCSREAFPIQADEHFLTVLRYVERNALRARLVKRAEDWAWGSLRPRLARGGSELLAPLPVELPRNWKAAVNEPQTEAEVAAIRHSIQRGTPFGTEAWTKRAATRLGLQSTLRPRGRTAEEHEKVECPLFSPFY
jgi:putative transposase